MNFLLPVLIKLTIERRGSNGKVSVIKGNSASDFLDCQVRLRKYSENGKYDIKKQTMRCKFLFSREYWSYDTSDSY